jgi:hypothetical protein
LFQQYGGCYRVDVLVPNPPLAFAAGTALAEAVLRLVRGEMFVQEFYWASVPTLDGTGELAHERGQGAVEAGVIIGNTDHESGG